MTKIGIAGYGEVGQALGKVYSTNNIDFAIQDKYKQIDDNFENIVILNICLPFIEKNSFVYLIRCTADCVLLVSVVIINFFSATWDTYCDLSRNWEQLSLGTLFF